MKKLFKPLLINVLHWLGIPSLYRTLRPGGNVTILTYHDIEANLFLQHCRLLTRHYHIISLRTFLEAKKNGTVAELPKRSLVITFDDGMKDNYKLLEIVKRHQIPITIFLVTGIINTHRHFWFRELTDKQLKRDMKQQPNEYRLQKLKELLDFEQTKEYSDRQSLNNQEIIEMSEFIDFQSHTVFHPILTNCPPDESKREIFDSRIHLQQTFDFKVYAIAFSNGDYGEREIQFCKEAGYELALTTDHGFNTQNTDNYLIKRICIGDTDSPQLANIKASGLWEKLK